MEESFWKARWDEGRIGWHREDVNPALIRNADRLLKSDRERILVPLCGKSVDLPWIVSQGHEVVGIELVQAAVEEFFADQGIQPEVDRIRSYSRYRAPGMTVLQGDFLNADPEIVGRVTGVLDRGALVALPPDVRVPYARKLHDLVPAGAAMLLLTLEYDQGLVDGPPFAVSEQEVRERFGGFELELLLREPDDRLPPKFEQAGVRASEVNWLLTRL